MKFSFYILLFVTFIDFMGIGLVYPLFSKLFFDNNLNFLSPDTTLQMRGFWLGLLFALMPLIQFFSSPIWGTLSDIKGRKKTLQSSLGFTVFGHFISVLGIIFSNIFLLLLSRIILGVGGGNISVVQASIADFSSKEEKAKNFGIYAMAIGAGFTMGPFFGGSLSEIGFGIPFIFATILTVINLLLVIYLFKETHGTLSSKKIDLAVGLANLKRAFNYKNIRVIFLCSFLTAFAWTYFLDFVPVYLIKNFKFSPANIGFFYGTIGGVYSISAGYLIRPFLSRFKPETLFCIACFIASICVLSVSFYKSIILFIPFILIFSFFSSFIGPTSTTLISNCASKEIQGEALGILGSVNTASYALSALLAGSFVGMNPKMPMWIGGSLFLLVSLILFGVYSIKLKKHS